MRAIAFSFFILLSALSFSRRGFAAELGASGRPVPTAQKPTSVAGAAKPKSNGLAATVRTDGAMVYAKPDFDSDVLATLKQNEKIRVSDGTIGDFAKFHKVRAGVVLGYIAEIDVQVEGAAKKRDHKRGAGKGKTADGRSDGKTKDDKAPKKKFKDEHLPILFTKYIGLLIGTSEYAESINGLDAKDNLLMYGLKITGPDILLSGPIMDVNIAFHYGAPSYYAPLAAAGTKPSGFILQADTLLLLPFFQRDTVMGTFGLGPMIKFSTIGITSGTDPRSLTELDFGLSLAGGFAFKIYKFALRLEGKYMIEKHTERMFQLGLQQQF